MVRSSHSSVMSPMGLDEVSRTVKGLAQSNLLGKGQHEHLCLLSGGLRHGRGLGRLSGGNHVRIKGGTVRHGVIRNRNIGNRGTGHSGLGVSGLLGQGGDA